MSQMPPELSIIIPAYNEGKRLGRGLSRIREHFASQAGGIAGIEILVVDDGSTDDTARIAQDWARDMPSLRLVSNGENRGKGYSVRHGMLEARGRVAIFTDADLSSPIEESEKLLSAIPVSYTHLSLQQGRYAPALFPGWQIPQAEADVFADRKVREKREVLK